MRRSANPPLCWRIEALDLIKEKKLQVFSQCRRPCKQEKSHMPVDFQVSVGGDLSSALGSGKDRVAITQMSFLPSFLILLSSLHLLSHQSLCFRSWALC